MKILVVITTALLMAGCHKQRVKMPEDEPRPTTAPAPGFSADLSKLNGYLVLTETRISRSVTPPNPFKSKSLIAFAMFREPVKSLTQAWDRIRARETTLPNTFYQGIVSVNDVYCHTVLLNTFGYQSYRANFTINDTVPFPVNWSVKGNKTFHPFSTGLSRGFPQINDTLALRDTVYAATGYVINTGSFVSGYDSVMVYFRTANGAETILRGGSNTSRLVLSQQKVAEIWQSWPPECYIVACSYMHSQVNGKTMQFETCSRLRYQPVFKQ